MSAITPDKNSTVKSLLQNKAAFSLPCFLIGAYLGSSYSSNNSHQIKKSLLRSQWFVVTINLAKQETQILIEKFVFTTKFALWCTLLFSQMKLIAILSYTVHSYLLSKIASGWNSRNMNQTICLIQIRLLKWKWSKIGSYLKFRFQYLLRAAYRHNSFALEFNF